MECANGPFAIGIGRLSPDLESATRAQDSKRLHQMAPGVSSRSTVTTSNNGETACVSAAQTGPELRTITRDVQPTSVSQGKASRGMALVSFAATITCLHQTRGTVSSRDAT